MNKMALILPFVTALSGCYSVPEKVSSSYDVSGNYIVVADCAFQKIQTEGGWTRADFPSQSRIEFTSSLEGVPMNRLTISDSGGSVAHIVGNFRPTLGGPLYLDEKYGAVVKACAVQPVAPATSGG